MKRITPKRAEPTTTVAAAQEVLTRFDRPLSGAAGSLPGRPYDHFVPRVG
jgi:hypothetical protein